MAKQLLRNVYYSTELDRHVENEKCVRGFKTKSQLIRLILKQHYFLCIWDTCTYPALFSDLCSLHLSQVSKKLRKENEGEIPIK